MTQPKAIQPECRALGATQTVCVQSHSPKHEVFLPKFLSKNKSSYFKGLGKTVAGNTGSPVLDCIEIHVTKPWHLHNAGAGDGFGYSTNSLWGQDLVCNKLEFIQQYLARKKTPMLIRCHQKLHTHYLLCSARDSIPFLRRKNLGGSDTE